MTGSDLGSLSDLLTSTSGKAEKSEPVAVDKNTELLHHVKLKNIVEDADQCRTEFDEEFIEDLAADIKINGVKAPVIVGSPDKKGMYPLKAGAQRYRASKIAGLERIPARIDDKFDMYDQVNENKQRKSLLPKDLAAFIQRRIDAGDKKGVIAKRLRMSGSQVSEALSFNSLPKQVIDRVYGAGLVTDQGALYQLSLILKAKPGVEKGLITQIEQNGGATVAYLKNYKKALNQEGSSSNQEAEIEKSAEAKTAGNPDNNKSTPKEKANKKGESISVMRLVAKYDGAEVEIIPTRKPTKKGLAWAVSAGKTIEVELSKTELLFFKD